MAKATIDGVNTMIVFPHTSHYFRDVIKINLISL